jgi:hypothetical protein
MTRTRIALVLVSLVLGAVVFAWGGVLGAEPPVTIDVAGGADGSLSMVWGGDTFLGDGAAPQIDAHGHDWPLRKVRHLLDADVVILNAEAPITTRSEPFIASKIYTYHTHPDAARALSDAGVSVLGLGNNHAMDVGPLGLADTIRHATAAGMTTFGAGANEAEAERPLLVRQGDTSIGIVAIARGYGTSITAAPRRAGTVAISVGTVRRGYELARDAGADIVIAYVHWGSNYRGITEEQRMQAQWFADAGYDLVIGTGPHIMNPIEIIGSMPVLYSLGNFVFGSPGSYTSDTPGYGLVLETTFGQGGSMEAKATCLITDNDRVDYQPDVCGVREAAEMFRGIGVPTQVEGATAILDLTP